MRKRIAVISTMLLIGLCYLLAFRAFDQVALPAGRLEPADTKTLEIPEKQSKEQLAYRFIQQHLLCSNGEILTNTRPRSGDLGTLSESVGLLMTYAVQKGDRALFDKEYKYLTSGLMTSDSWVPWKSGEEAAHCNALVDDLRIIRALLEGCELWGGKDYEKTAGRIGENIFKNQVSGGDTAELYDWKAKSRKNTIPLCYLDLEALDRLKPLNDGWGKAAAQGRKLIAKGSINKNLPFYYKYYDYGKKTYAMDEEVRAKKGICLIYTLLTALHLAEVNAEPQAFHAWLSCEADKGKLYAWYDPISGKPAQDMESTAVYALGALYAHRTGDHVLMEKLIGRMLRFMVLNEKSPYYGGFGNADTGEFYSFDNLTALLALAAAQK